MKILIFLLIMLNKFVLADIVSIDNMKLRDLLDKGIKVVDIREKDELVTTGIIENSYVISLLNRNIKFNFNEWTNRFSKIELKDNSVVFVCAKGVRSNIIARLISKKLPNLRIYNLKKGIDDWIRSGNLIVQY